MSRTVAEIAAALGARVEGDGTIQITGAAEPADAGEGDIALAMTPAYAKGLAQGRARAAVLWDGADWKGFGLAAAIFVPRPRYAMAGITRALDRGPEIAPGIHPTAVIDPGALIGPGAAIGPFAVIGRGVRIGPRARIASHVSIAEGAHIGEDALLNAGVRIGPRVKIGDRFIANPGAVLGGDGFAFVTPERSGVEEIRENLADRTEIRAQSWTRIHSLGSVEIGDDVEIGANTTIDRGTIRDTRVGSGTKIDNLVMLGHNVTVGRDCLIVSQVGIAGSTRVGDRVVLGGQVGVSDNIFIGNDVIAGARTEIRTNVPAGRVILGAPAMKMEQTIQTWKHIRRLGRLYDQVAELRRAVLGEDRRAGQKEDDE